MPTEAVRLYPQEPEPQELPQPPPPTGMVEEIEKPD